MNEKKDYQGGHGGGFSQRCPIYTTKKPSPRQKSWANGIKNGILANKQICLQES
jgi:hypothetical protein